MTADAKIICEVLDVLMQQLPEGDKLVKVEAETGAVLKVAGYRPPYECYVRAGQMRFFVEAIGPMAAFAIGAQPKKDEPHVKKRYEGFIVDDAWTLSLVATEVL